VKPKLLALILSVPIADPLLTQSVRNSRGSRETTILVAVRTNRGASGVSVGDVTIRGVRFLFVSARAERVRFVPELIANQMASIFRKLGLGSRVQLIARLTEDEGHESAPRWNQRTSSARDLRPVFRRAPAK
jgi:hypothetical protein